jgi:hypothetical protein
MLRSSWRWLAGCVALAVPLAVPAHHSVAFYSNDKIELRGEITKIEWQNPHIQFGLRTVGSDGVEKMWRLESSSIFLRLKDGVTRDLFRAGDEVKVFGRTSARDASAILVTNMLLPDGREAPLWPDAAPHFVSADRMIKATPQLVDAAAENRGIFRVWRPDALLTPGRLEGLPYTDAAVAARKSFDLLAASARCEPEGMPRIMIALFPFELVDHGREISLRTELYDTQRTIHMDRTAPPPGEPASKLGYSVGEWRDGQLIVNTTRVNWPYFDQSGTPISENVQIEEHFKVNGDQTRLDYELTVVDPATFKSPATLDFSWLAYGDTIQRYDCRRK